jgi:hypothetical protein
MIILLRRLPTGTTTQNLFFFSNHFSSSPLLDMLAVVVSQMLQKVVLSIEQIFNLSRAILKLARELLVFSVYASKMAVSVLSGAFLELARVFVVLFMYASEMAVSISPLHKCRTAAGVVAGTLCLLSI